VVGAAGDETVYLINGSGEFLSGEKTAEGGMDWDTAIKPGGGSSAPGIDFYSPDEGYVTDTNSKVYRTTDGGESFETVGIDGASVGLFDVGAINEGDLSKLISTREPLAARRRTSSSKRATPSSTSIPALRADSNSLSTWPQADANLGITLDGVSASAGPAGVSVFPSVSEPGRS
jgi:hypothetical protein